MIRNWILDESGRIHVIIRKSKQTKSTRHDHVPNRYWYAATTEGLETRRNRISPVRRSYSFLAEAKQILRGSGQAKQVL